MIPPAAIPPLTEKQITGFWAKVDKRGPEDCWLWKASLDHNGYGQFRVGAQTVKAHRIAIGSRIIPELAVAHTCDNRRCVNPAHLFPASHSENMRDMWTKGRGRCGPFFGEENGLAVLTVELVQTLRTAYSTGQYSYAQLATQHGVAKSTVMRAVKGQTWAHLG